MQKLARRALLPLLLFALPALAGERLDAVISDLHAHGYASAAKAAARLRAVDDRPAVDAPLAQRQRYYAALGEYASLDRKPASAAIAEGAASRLAAMATREGCGTCALDALMVRAQVAFSRRDFAEGARVLATVQATGASEEQKLNLHLLRAQMYRQQGLYAQGVAEALPAVELATRQGNAAAHVAALNTLLVLNAYLGDHARAEAFGQEAFALAERIGTRRMMAEIQLNLGFNYSQAGHEKRFLAAYQRGLEIVGDDPDMVLTRVILLSNLADYWLQQQDYRQALGYAQRAAVQAQQAKELLGGAFALTNAGVAKAHLGDVEAGIADIREANHIAAQVGAPTDVIGITYELAGVLEYAGRYREALAEVRKVESLQREATRQERDKAVLELQEKYASEKRQREIERLGDANRIKEAQLSAQAWQRRLWAAVAVVLALAAVVLMQWLKRVRSANQKLSDDVAVLAEQSAHDPLTGVFNRRHGHSLLSRYSKLARTAAPGAAPALGVVMLDIDFFKRVNDTYGHAAGDKVLVEVAQRLRSLLRAQDAVVRWGGEEFLLLLPNTPAIALPMLAGRVLHVIAATPIAVGATAITVTASAGCVASPFGRMTDIEALVQLADLALYRGKATGRNRAICVDGAAPDLDAAALGEDLAVASANGKVSLQTVLGPATTHASSIDEAPVQPASEG